MMTGTEIEIIYDREIHRRNSSLFL